MSNVISPPIITTSNISSLSIAQSELSKLAEDCSKILQARSLTTKQLKNYSELQNLQIYQNLPKASFPSNFSEIASNSESSTLESTPRDCDSSCENVKIKTSRNSKQKSIRFPVQTQSEILSITKENKQFRDTNCRLRLKTAEWESKAASLADSLADMQRELLMKNQEMVQFKQTVLEKESNYQTSLSKLKNDHQNDLQNFNEKARQLDERNLALASQIKLLEQDLINRDGKLMNFTDESNSILNSHRSAIENLKSGFKNEKIKLKRDYIDEKEKSELSRIKCAQLDADLEREKNDSRAKSRQLKLLKSELSTIKQSMSELDVHSATENKRLLERLNHTEELLKKNSIEYNKKLDILTNNYSKSESIKSQLEKENENLLLQMKSDVKTYANAKNLKTALTLVNDQKIKLSADKKRLKSQLNQLKSSSKKSNENTGNEISDLIQKVESLNRKNVALESKANGLEAKLYHYQKENEKLENNLNNKTTEFDKLINVKQKLVSKIDNLEKNMEIVVEKQKLQLSEVTSEKAKITTEVTALKEALRRLSNKASSFNKDKEILQIELEQSKSNTTNLTDKNTNLQDQISQLKIKLAKNDEKPWKNAFEASNSQREKLQNELNNVKESKFQYESTNLDLIHEQKKNKSLEKQILNKNAEIAKLKAQLNVKKNVCNDYTIKDQKDLKIAHDVNISKSRQLIKNNKDLREEVKLLNSKIESLCSLTSKGETSSLTSIYNDLNSRTTSSLSKTTATSKFTIDSKLMDSLSLENSTPDIPTTITSNEPNTPQSIEKLLKESEQVLNNYKNSKCVEDCLESKEKFDTVLENHYDSSGENSDENFNQKHEAALSNDEMTKTSLEFTKKLDDLEKR